MPADQPGAPLPESDKPLLLRTDFTDDAAWQALREALGSAEVTFLDGAGYREVTAYQLMELVPADSPHPVLLVADDATFAGDDRTLLVIDLVDEPGQTFRAMPDAIHTVVGNLFIANMSFADFMNSAAATDGVYRLSARYHEALAELTRASELARQALPADAMRKIPGPSMHRRGAPAARRSIPVTPAKSASPGRRTQPPHAPGDSPAE
ncbi:MAG TPA: hypothetical protein VHW44_18155 [Pseudonocardiaceae bacterium]|jgi:hypothetical protein|nr:hypothetical protein [Pseudonocardiaceae bacterium]